jgi:hypothetical protein
MKKIYISGKITGEKPNDVEKKFHDAMVYLCQHGWTVCNPLHISNTGMQYQWNHNMGEDIKELSIRNGYLTIIYQQP